jgi:hypothetical protein
MAKLFGDGSLPITDKWMPFYSILIGLVHIITSLSLLKSTFIVNTCLFGLILMMIHKITLQSSYLSIPFQIVGFIVFTTNQLFISSGITIMAELPLLFWILIFCLKLHRTVENTHWTFGQVTLLSIIVLCSILTKYNGLVLFIILLLSIFYFDRSQKKYLKILLCSFIVLVPYYIWSHLKADEEVIMTAILKNSFMQNISINLIDLFKTLTIFIFNERIYYTLTAIFNQNFQILFMVAFLIGIAALVLFEFITNKNKIEFIFISFSLIYILSLTFLLSIAGVNEMNTRTAFYPLMVSLLYLIIKTKRENNKQIIRLTSSSILTIILCFNTIKLIDYCKISYSKGNGALNKDYFQNKNQSLDYALQIIQEKGLSNKQIHTNENKVIPILLDYKIMEPIPTNPSWIGNYEQKKDSTQIKQEIQKLSDQISKENHILCFFGSNSKKIYDRVYSPQFSDINLFTIKEFNDGVIITSKRY